MNKKVIAFIVVIILLVIIGGVIFFINQNSSENSNDQENLANQTEENSQSGTNTVLAEEANSGNWLEGQRFSSNPSDSDINNFTDSLK